VLVGQGPDYSPIVRAELPGFPSFFHTRLLTPADLEALQDLLERSGDYFEIATGKPPAKDEARRAFVAGPPSKAVNDKRVVGLFGADDKLVGVLDSITNWPSDGQWTMGMLLLDPAIRNRGIGASMLESYEGWARSQGAVTFRTAIVGDHERGIRFLEQAGYRRETTLPDYDAGGRRATVIFLTKTADRQST
jgi:GNAT superfamily N-acetyltransferase